MFHLPRNGSKQRNNLLLSVLLIFCILAGCLSPAFAVNSDPASITVYYKATTGKPSFYYAVGTPDGNWTWSSPAGMLMQPTALDGYYKLTVTLPLTDISAIQGFFTVFNNSTVTNDNNGGSNYSFPTITGVYTIADGLVKAGTPIGFPTPSPTPNITVTATPIPTATPIATPFAINFERSDTLSKITFSQTYRGPDAIYGTYKNIMYKVAPDGTQLWKTAIENDSFYYTECISLSEDQQVIASCSEKTIYLFDSNSGKLLRTYFIPRDDGDYNEAYFRSSGGLVPGLYGRIQLDSINSNLYFFRYLYSNQQNGGLFMYEYAPDGTFLNRMKNNGPSLYPYDGVNPNDTLDRLVVTPDKIFYTVKRYNSFKILDKKNKTFLNTSLKYVCGNGKANLGFLINPDDIFRGEDVTLFDLTTLSEVKRVKISKFPLTSCVISDQKIFYSTTKEGYLYSIDAVSGAINWKISTGAKLYMIDPQGNLILDNGSILFPDGTFSKVYFSVAPSEVHISKENRIWVYSGGMIYYSSDKYELFDSNAIPTPVPSPIPYETPIPPSATNKVVTIYYKGNLQYPYLHYRKSATKWTVAPGDYMDISEVAGYRKATIMFDSNDLEAVFNNGREDDGNVKIWDKNGIYNYKISNVKPLGSYTYHQGAGFTEGAPSVTNTPVPTIEPPSLPFQTPTPTPELSPTPAVTPGATPSTDWDIVTFTVKNCPVMPGQTCKIVGDFGDWNVGGSIQLNSGSSSYPNWTGTKAFPKDSVIKFKAVKVSPTGTLTWETGNTRRLATFTSMKVTFDFGNSSITIEDTTLSTLPANTPASTAVVTIPTPAPSTTPVVSTTPKVTPSPTSTPSATPTKTPAPTPSPTVMPTAVPTATTSLALVNGGFENGNYSGWSEWHPNGQPAKLNVDATDASEGKFKLYFWSATDYQQSIHQTLNNLPNGQYTISVSIKLSSFSGVNPSYARMEVDDFIGSQTLTNFAANGKWTNYSSTVNVTTGKIDIGFYLNAKGNTSMQIDKVTISRASPK